MNPVVIFGLSILAAAYMAAAAQTVAMLKDPIDSAESHPPTVSAAANLMRPELYAQQ